MCLNFNQNRLFLLVQITSLDNGFNNSGLPVLMLAFFSTRLSRVGVTVESSFLFCIINPVGSLNVLKPNFDFKNHSRHAVYSVCLFVVLVTFVG